MARTRGTSSKREKEEEEALLPLNPKHAEVSDDSDDEAPEEVELGVSKQTAAKRRQEERQAAAAASQAAKKRRTRSRQRDTSKDDDQVEKEEKEGKGKEEHKEDEDDDDDDDDQLDLLPEDVLAEIGQTDRRPYEHHIISQQLRKLQEDEEMRKQAKKKKNFDDDVNGVQVGPVSVKVLNAMEGGRNKVSASARDFMKSRLYGVDVKRSRDMLLPTKAVDGTFVYRAGMQSSWDDSLKELLQAQIIDGFALYDAFQRDRLLSAFGNLKDGIWNDHQEYFNQIDVIFQGRDVPSSFPIALDHRRLIVTLCTTDKIYAISRGKKLGLLVYNQTNQGILIISFSQPCFLQHVVPIVEKALFGFPPRLQLSTSTEPHHQ